MGTRADFYIGDGSEVSQWVGSIAWDGMPPSLPKGLIEAEHVSIFRKEIAILFNNRVGDHIDEREHAFKVTQERIDSGTIPTDGQLDYELYRMSDVSYPADEWPWPWETSAETDWTYCFDGGRVVTFYYGMGPLDPKALRTEEDYDRQIAIGRVKKHEFVQHEVCEQPPMHSPRSGVLVVPKKPGSGPTEGIFIGMPR